MSDNNSNFNEGSMMDEILRQARLEKGADMEIDKKQYPKEFKRPRREYGDYVRKFSFEILLYNLNDQQKSAIDEKISEEERKKIYQSIVDFKYKIDFYKFYDNVCMGLKNSTKKLEEKYLNDYKEKSQDVDFILRTLMGELRTWLNLGGFLAKDLTPEDQLKFVKNKSPILLKKFEDETVRKVQENQQNYNKEMVKLAIIFNYYYNTFVKELPDMISKEE